MLSLLKRYREVLIVGVLLLYPLGAFLTTGLKPRPANWADRAIAATRRPIEWVVAGAFKNTSEAISSYVALVDTHQQNASLKTELARLREELASTSETRAENERLRRMLGYTQANPGVKVPARVIAINPVSTHLSLRIDRGERDGLKRGMPVVTPDGVVGYVLRTTGSASDVLLLTDPQARLGVRVQRTRARATAAGAGPGEPLRLENALRTEPLEEGDLLVTSGGDGVFPSGLVVGRVSAVERRTNGSFLEANVLLSVDMTKVEEVFVLPPATDAALPMAGAIEGGR